MVLALLRWGGRSYNRHYNDESCNTWKSSVATPLQDCFELHRCRRAPLSDSGALVLDPHGLPSEIHAPSFYGLKVPRCLSFFSCNRL